MVLGQPASVLLCLLSAEAKHETGIRLNVVRTSVIWNMSPCQGRPEVVFIGTWGGFDT